MVSGGQMRTGWQVVITVISLCKIFKLHNLGSSEMEMLSCSWALNFSRYYSTEVQARKQTSAQMKIYYNINLCQYYNSGSQLASNCPVSILRQHPCIMQLMQNTTNYKLLWVACERTTSQNDLVFQTHFNLHPFLFLCINNNLFLIAVHVFILSVLVNISIKNNC